MARERTRLWKIIYFLMNTDYLIGLLRNPDQVRHKHPNRLLAQPFIRAYGHTSGMVIAGEILDENELKVFTNQLDALVGHLDNYYLDKSITYNLKQSLAYLGDGYDLIKGKYELFKDEELDFNEKEDPHEVLTYYKHLQL